MKRLIVVFLVAALTMPLAMPQALATAQITIEDAEGNVEVAPGEESAGDFTAEELDKIMTQDSPWYFLKRIFENIRLALTFKEDSKAELWSELAKERAKEYAALEKKYADEDIDEDQLKLLEEALKDLLEVTDQYMELVLDDDEEEIVVDEEVQGDKYLQRIAHLKRVAERAPEPAQDGLARAIANAQRQRARMISRGKLYDPDLETRYYAFSKFTYKLKLADYEIEVEYQQEKDELAAKVKIEQDDLMKVELKGYRALEYLLPIFDELDVNASMTQEDVVSAVLTAFAWKESFDEIEIKIKFNDGSSIDIDLDNDEKEEPKPVAPSLHFKFFDLEIKSNNEKLEVEYDQKTNKIKAKVQIKRQDSPDIHLKDDKALEYLLPIIEDLDLQASTPKAEVLDILLNAFAWETKYTKVKLKLQFSDGKTMDMHWKEEKPKAESPPANSETNLPYKSFELEIESDDRELEVKLELKKGKLEAKVEIEQEKGKDIELKGTKALDYLLPKLNKLKLNSSMSKKAIINSLLMAFNWQDEWEELELKIVFNDGKKISIEIDD